MAAEVPPQLLEVLCCPVNRDELHVENGQLVSTRLRRYPISEGIPVLFRDGSEEDGVAQIASAFRERAASYHSDNYAEGGNLARIRRLELATGALREILQRPARLLDIGAGPAVLAEAAGTLGVDYVALDASLENLLEGRRRLGEVLGVVGTVTALPFKDRTFDAIVALGCLEYVPDVEAAASELYRVLEPGGHLIVSFANARSPRCRWDESITHPLWRRKERLRGRGAALYRRYLRTEDDVCRTIARQGGRIESIEYLSPGLLAYPLSSVRCLTAFEERLAAGHDAIRRRAGEFLVIAST